MFHVDCQYVLKNRISMQDLNSGNIDSIFKDF
ncbi:hypothetical protein J2X77_002101 [Sphingobacterium sp. 2149]|nr:hypothetical protein [Sphingobacterium sp. 2149]